MLKVEVEIDDETAEWLAARIDDARPNLNEVVRDVLVRTVEGTKDQLGLRACNCGLTERQIHIAKSPIIFDSETSEYQLVVDGPDGRAKYLIRYCFVCGGAMPASTRARLFAEITVSEVSRLTMLCDGVRTFQDAIATFGPPDFDWADGLILHGSFRDDPPERSPRRVISYDGLSETAQVHFTQKVGDLVSVSLIGKYIGPKKT